MKYIVLFILMLSRPVYAKNSFLDQMFSQKQSKRSQDSWTLSGYLGQKKKFGLMDQWLQLNSSSQIFETVINGTKGNYTYKDASGTTANYTSDTYSISTYISIFGIKAKKTSTSQDDEITDYQLNVRLLGGAEQATNLTAFYGQSDWENKNRSIEVSNKYYGGVLSLYLFEFLGVSGEYTKKLEAKDKVGSARSGDKVSYEVFLDFNFIRLYGNMYTENNQTTTAGVTTVESNEGSEYGLKFFF